MMLRLALLFLSTSLVAVEPFVLITVPKSGSHLIIKALHFLTGAPPVWHTHFPSFWCIPPDQGFLYTHFCIPPELERNYQSLSRLKQIVMIRDLRDVAISMVGHITKSPWPGLSGKEREHFLSLSFDEQLLFVINYDYDIYEIAEKCPHANQVSLRKIALQAAEYAQDPNRLTIRYEDLVGPQGGGSLAAQLDALAQMAAFIDADPSSLCEIAEQLYGNEHDPFGKGELQNYQSTFASGSIGRWKTLFKPEHIRAFKEKIGSYLIALGYEHDDNW